MPVMGLVGGGLMDGNSGVGHYATAAIGLKGERATAELIGNPKATVMHDLYIPDSGNRANIDHLIIAGSKIWIIDSKVWKPGFYWTVGTKTFRGLGRFKSYDERSGKWNYPAEKKTMEMARDRMVKYLRSRGLNAEVLTPTLVLYPSNKSGGITAWMLTIPGANVMTPGQLGSKARRFARTPADPKLVNALRQLLVTNNRSQWS